MIDHLDSIDKGLYLPDYFENLLEVKTTPTDLYELNLKSLAEFNNDLVLLCNQYKGTSDPSTIRSLNEASVEAIFDYMQKVSNNCQKAWDNFKKAKDTEKIIDVINKQNQPYFGSGFRMQCPPGFYAPLINEWNRIKNSAKVIILTEASYNANKPYMENELSFKHRFYRNNFDEDYEDFYDNWKRKVFVKTTGKEVIGQQEVTEFVNFLTNYNAEIDEIGNDIDCINTTNKNIKTMLQAVPTEEAFDMVLGLNQIINEYGIQLGSKFKDANEVYNKKIKTQTISFNREQKKMQKKEAKNDKKYLVNYYSISMEVISTKMKLCNTIKNQSIKILKKYISLQPKKIKDNPELGAQYAKMQAQRNANPDFQIKK